MKRRVTIETVEPLSHRWAKLDRYTIRYTRSDGREDVLMREVHDHGHGAAVLPYDAKRGTVLLVRQFRVPAFLHDGDGFIIEACAGLLDGDDPAHCAKREAEEELGVHLASLRFMTTVYSSPGAVTERISLFIADYDHDARIGVGGGHAHEGEDIEVLEMPFDGMRRMVQEGRIADAKTVLLSLFLERELGLPPL
ncbi:MAG: NUDIX domain-containing protein [Aestuariivirga sp.]|uniref:NUDIX domain-containing protein n=1 Tax=Aestuariivirga sp. TaxID=2650926 RepID=UPI0025BB7197|nr:NUDIX domain-containing protein [Aestuariivirga sp.]MCA3561168.1 NUDIX domain-containing protein [Aestuariivirga sp.]